MTRAVAAVSPSMGRKWTQDEHARFLEAMALYPRGPWKQRAKHVGTRTARQIMTHAHKLQLKQERHARGLFRAGRPPRGTAPKPVATNRPNRQRDTPSTLEQQEPTPSPPPLPPLSLPPMESDGGFMAMLQPAAPIHGLQLVSLEAANAWCAPGGPVSPLSPAAGAFAFDSDDVAEVFDSIWDVDGMANEAIV